MENLSFLIVEDEEMFMDVAANMLSGSKVYKSTNVAKAISQYKENRPDITLLDISLPDGKGMQALHEIRKINENAFIVALTSSSLKADVEDYLNNGVQGYIIKPLSRKSLKELINKYYATNGQKNE